MSPAQGCVFGCDRSRHAAGGGVSIVFQNLNTKSSLSVDVEESHTTDIIAPTTRLVMSHRESWRKQGNGPVLLPHNLGRTPLRGLDVLAAP